MSTLLLLLVIVVSITVWEVIVPENTKDNIRKYIGDIFNGS